MVHTCRVTNWGGANEDMAFSRLSSSWTIGTEPDSFIPFNHWRLLTGRRQKLKSLDTVLTVSGTCGPATLDRLTFMS